MLNLISRGFFHKVTFPEVNRLGMEGIGSLFGPILFTATATALFLTVAAIRLVYSDFNTSRRL